MTRQEAIDAAVLKEREAWKAALHVEGPGDAQKAVQYIVDHWVRHEREACAMIADAKVEPGWDGVGIPEESLNEWAREIAQAIRGRGVNDRPETR